MNNSDSTVYIYALIDPRDERVRYVGQTVNPARRFRSHLADKSVSTPKRDWLDELLLLGLMPIMEVVEECQKGTVDEKEVYWIAYYRNLNTDLLNVLDGGSWQGTMSDAIRARMSNRHKGCTLTNEHKKKISDSLKGRTHTNERKKKISDARKGQAHTDETKKKISDALKGHTFTDEARKNISDAGKGRTHTEEARKNMSDGQKGKPHPRSQLSVAQYDLDGSFIEQFPSRKEASEKTGIDSSSISACVNNRRRKAGGYQWKKVQ